MSILLDALKKSEEQRRLGKAPDLHGPADHKPEGGQKNASQWLPAVLLSVATVSIMWFVWAQYRVPETVAVSEMPQVSQKPTANDELTEGSSPPAQPARTPVESYAGQAGEAGAADETEPGDASQRQDVARSFNQFQRTGQADSAVPEQEPVPDTPSQPVSGKPDIIADNARGAVEAQSPPKPHVSEPVSYWELPQNVRDDMPEFHITVMVYAEEPGERFMLINGQRLVERESIEGVELEEIRRNGAVFRYRNYRFLVKG